jgi:DNA-binding response OmpR family regulator
MKHGRIYMAEDDKARQTGLSSVLKQNGFEITVFNSGYPLVEMTDNWPDVFLIDIELPGINGLEVCKWLKSHDSSSNIPVILLSGDAYLKVLASAARADDYMEKPVLPQALIARIKEVMLTKKMDAF